MSAVGAAPGRSAWQRALRRVFPARIDRPPAADLSPPAWIGGGTERAAEAEVADAGDARDAETTRDGKVYAFGAWIAPSLDADGLPEWNVDPFGGVRWPTGPRTRAIPIRGVGRPGDVKLVWEPSRFLHLFDRVYDGPEGERQAVRDVASWIDGTRLGRGVHWDNGLEAALRAISWIHADAVLARRGGEAWLELRPRLLASLATHARFIDAHVEPAAWNHLVGDAAGLVVIGASYPGLDGADGWLGRGLALLESEVERQVLADGGHAERAPAYARFVADLYLVAARAVRTEDRRRAELFADVARRMLENLLRQAPPSARHPGYGDDDGATVLWTCEPGERLAVSAALAGASAGWPDGALFARATAAWPRARVVTARVLGADALAGLDALAAAATADPDGRDLPAATVRTGEAGPPEPWVLPSVVLRDTGVAVGRRAGAWALVRCGPAGAGNGAHAHMDQLAVLWESPAGWALVDPGTPTYNADDALREASTATRAHATVSIDGASQAERTGRFAWGDLPTGRLVGVTARGGRWTAHGAVAYRVGEAEVAHGRQVTLRDDSLELADEIRVPGRHEASLVLLLRSDGRTAPAWDATARRVTAEGRPPLDLVLSGWERIEAEPAQAFPVYAKSEPVLALRLGATMEEKLFASVALRVASGSAR